VTEALRVVASSGEVSLRERGSLQIVHAGRAAHGCGRRDVVSRRRWVRHRYLRCIFRFWIFLNRALDSKPDCHPGSEHSIILKVSVRSGNRIQLRVPVHVPVDTSGLDCVACRPQSVTSGLREQACSIRRTSWGTLWRSSFKVSRSQGGNENECTGAMEVDHTSLCMHLVKTEVPFGQRFLCSSARRRWRERLGNGLGSWIEDLQGRLRTAKFKGRTDPMPKTKSRCCCSSSPGLDIICSRESWMLGDMPGRGITAWAAESRHSENRIEPPARLCTLHLDKTWLFKWITGTIFVKDACNRAGVADPSRLDGGKKCAFTDLCNESEALLTDNLHHLVLDDGAGRAVAHENALLLCPR